jgi:uroporphyrinogen-III synthase
MPAGSDGARLAGCRILLTRPQPESEVLARRIEAAGGAALVFPTLEIQPAPLSDASRAALGAVPRARLAVFVSTNAVRHGMPLIRLTGGWPPALAVAAVGQATADLLREGGLREVWVPEAGGDSEALLRHPRLQQVDGWDVIVFRGVGGRELLADGLRARGAHVDYVECYRRTAPAADPEPVRSALRADALHAIVASSAEGVRNLVEMIGADSLGALRNVPLVVTHENVARVARGLGFVQVPVARDAHDGVVECLVDLPVRHAP